MVYGFLQICQQICLDEHGDSLPSKHWDSLPFQSTSLETGRKWRVYQNLQIPSRLSTSGALNHMWSDMCLSFVYSSVMFYFFLGPGRAGSLHRRLLVRPITPVSSYRLKTSRLGRRHIGVFQMGWSGFGRSGDCWVKSTVTVVNMCVFPVPEGKSKVRSRRYPGLKYTPTMGSLPKCRQRRSPCRRRVESGQAAPSAAWLPSHLEVKKRHRPQGPPTPLKRIRYGDGYNML